MATVADILKSGTWCSSSTIAPARRARRAAGRHVDTGLGFERMVAILQGVDSNYKTDLFIPSCAGARDVGPHDCASEENLIAYRVIADHSRAVTFLIGDGVLPGNVGRSYVLRMILRRAARFGRKIGFSKPFLADVADRHRDDGQHFTELVTRRDYILRVITEERNASTARSTWTGAPDGVLAAQVDQIVRALRRSAL